MSQLNISLDWDGTYSAAPQMWNNFLELITGSDTIKVYVVTLRAERDFDAPMQWLANSGLVKQIIFCDGQSKRMVTEALGIHIDIWIDDQPECIEGGSSLSLEQLEQWRKDQLKAITIV